jgi:hypothetical protein
LGFLLSENFHHFLPQRKNFESILQGLYLGQIAGHSLRFVCTIIQLHQSKGAYFDRVMVIPSKIFLYYRIAFENINDGICVEEEH